MIRIRRTLKVLHVARRAIRRRTHKLPIDVAKIAGNRGVRSGQRELRKGAVVERRGIPRAGAMASLTSGREAGLRVRRIVGLIKVRHMATHTACRRQRELAARVAGVAVQARMRPGQGKARDRMVELGAQPVVHRVAAFARSRQL